MQKIDGIEETSSRESERIQNRTGGAGSERIRSSDVSDALAEVLREETRLPRASAHLDGKDLDGKKTAARPNSKSLNGLEGRYRPPKKANTTGVDHKTNPSNDGAGPKAVSLAVLLFQGFPYHRGPR